MSAPSLARTARRRVAAPLLAVAALFATAAWLEAHDFWVIPAAFPFAEGADIEVLGQTSTAFPTSVSAVAVERVARAVLVGTAGESRITELAHRGTSLLLRAKPAAAGQYVVAVSLASRSSRQDAVGLLRWLRLEGAADAADRIEREGLLRGVDSLTRTDTKHAKTLVQVGAGGPRAFERSGGQAIEFVPLQDAATLRAGDTLRLRLVFRGQPAVGVGAHAGVAPTGSEARGTDLHLVTDANGEVRLPIPRTGLWNIRAIHVTSSAPTVWETHWASFAFHAGH